MAPEKSRPMCDRSHLTKPAKLSFTEVINKIVNECDRRGMRPPYTFRFTGPDGAELEIVTSDDLNDINESKSRGGASFKGTITVTVEDRDGCVLTGPI
jgi:hypothetical protein